MRERQKREREENRVRERNYQRQVKAEDRKEDRNP